MSSYLTRPTRTVALTLTCVLVAIMDTSLSAQSNGGSNLFYDLSKEVTLQGTVSAVLNRPRRGMSMGSHLILITASGTVDTSLGRWGLGGKDSFSIVPGQQLEAVGVMKSVGGQNVFVARLLKAEGKTLVIRNSHGIAVSPQSRERNAVKETGGGSL